MTPEKKAARTERNKQAKTVKREIRQANLAVVGRLVFEKEVPTGETNEDGTQKTKTVLCLPPFIRTASDGSILPLKNREPRSVPSLAFIGAKTYRHHGGHAKTRPGNKELHGEAIVELHSRSLAVAIDAVLNPPEGTPIPVVPENAAQEVAQL